MPVVWRRAVRPTPAMGGSMSAWAGTGWRGPELTVAGPWRLRIDLLVSDFEKQSPEARVTVGSGSGTHLH